jgi:hypothetical protein
MKKLIALFFTASVSFGLIAQPENSSDIVQVTKRGLKEPKEVYLHSSPIVLQVGHYLIPISPNTQIKVRKEKENYSVWFALQNGTSITSINDAQWRRASFELSFKSKPAAKNFIRLFEEAVAGTK